MLYLGIDGGGTKTEAVLCSEDGVIVARAIAGASAPISVPVPQLTSTLRQLFADLNLDARGNVVGYAGISGCATERDRSIFERCSREVLPGNVSLRTGSDCVCAFNAAIGPGTDGILLIAGTGSISYLRKDGNYHRIGGWGYLLGDEGSGYDMGRRALNAALRAYDGRGPQTLLQKLVEDRIGARVNRVTDSVYEHGRSEIASYARILITAAEAGDAVALSELDKSIEELRLHAATAIRAAGGETLPVVVAGGLVTGSDLVLGRLRQALESIPLIIPKTSPVYGAVLEAVGHETESFAKNYLEAYHA